MSYPISFRKDLLEGEYPPFPAFSHFFLRGQSSQGKAILACRGRFPTRFRRNIEKLGLACRATRVSDRFELILSPERPQAAPGGEIWVKPPARHCGRPLAGGRTHRERNSRKSKKSEKKCPILGHLCRGDRHRSPMRLR
jgi:hypothetical protein